MPLFPPQWWLLDANVLGPQRARTKQSTRVPLPASLPGACVWMMEQRVRLQGAPLSHDAIGLEHGVGAQRVWQLRVFGCEQGSRARLLCECRELMKLFSTSQAKPNLQAIQGGD